MGGLGGDATIETADASFKTICPVKSLWQSISANKQKDRMAEFHSCLYSQSDRTCPRCWRARYDVGCRLCGCWCRIIGDLESGTDKEDEVLVGFKG
jgi:hypothetical protein